MRSPLARAVSCTSASSVMSTRDAPTRSATPTPVAGSTETGGRLRNDSATRACSSASATRTAPVHAQPAAFRALAGQAADERGGLLRRRVVEAGRVEDRQRVVLDVHGEHAAQ